MTQEDKQLLLKDLCARSPYKPFAQWHHKVLNEFRDVRIMKISTYGKNIDDYRINVLCQPEPGVDYEASIVDIKPYLRPRYSMTEEEKKDFNKVVYESMNIDNISPSAYVADWEYSNHFDVWGLIPKGLAIAITEENNPYE